MIETPQIVQSPAQLVAKIHLTIPRSEIMHVMGPGIQELHAALKAQDITPIGPWFTHHLKNPSDTFDFEICLPVLREVKPSGRVKPGQLASRRVARTTYRGGYEGLGAAWGELEAWIKANGHQSAQDLWEVYAVGPESSPDPASWRTELNRPLME